jgi:hypothetical protein
MGRTTIIPVRIPPTMLLVSIKDSSIMIFSPISMRHCIGFHVIKKILAWVDGDWKCAFYQETLLMDYTRSLNFGMAQGPLF